jgi:UDP-glucose 4-epimerase
MKKVLLTGGAGFIGSHVADHLLEKGCAVTIYDNLSFGSRNHILDDVEFIEGDIADRDSVFSLFNEHTFDTVIHLAAIHFIPYCNQHPNLACRTNVEGTQNIFDAALASGKIERLFTASTAAVYPDMPGPIPETTIRGPMDVYGMTKSANEEQAAIFSRRSETHVSIGRFFNAVGGRETNPHLVPDILKRIITSDTIEIGNTAPKRDYIDVRDMARAVIAFVNGNQSSLDTCNIGTGLIFDVEEIVSIISEIHGRIIHLNPVEKLIRKVERMNLQADNARLSTRYAWSPKYSIKDSMVYAYEWYGRQANLSKV